MREILNRVDHTLLAQTATEKEIKNICNEGMEYGVASVCIPASHVKMAKEYVGDKLPVCTVIGFPNGYSTTESKVFETKDALNNGADEIDMVINLGWVKDKFYNKVQDEIEKIKNTCKDKILKVIIETCLLTNDEKMEMCKIVTKSGADFIKTSTGFSKAGATFEDIKLFKDNVGKNVRIKAAGGIGSLEDAKQFIDLGADRLGTSRIIKLINA